LTEETEPQPAQKVNKSEYLPYSQTVTLTDSNNRETIIRNISQEAANEVSAAFLANTGMSSNDKSGELSRSKAASVPSDSLSSLVGAGVKSKDQKKS
jgi:hypothetical protein